MSNKIKIIVVDDDEGIIDIIKSYLSHYDVVGYKSSKQAIDAMNKTKYDLLVLDYFVDDLNGAQIVKKIREFDNDIYILLLTGYANDVPGIKSLDEMDIQCFVEKGNSDELWVRLKSAIKSVEFMKGKVKDNILGLPLRLKELRKVYGVNQDDLATFVGVSRTNVANYERGFNLPSIDILMKIADYFGVSVDFLLGHTVGLPEVFKGK